MLILVSQINQAIIYKMCFIISSIKQYNILSEIQPDCSSREVNQQAQALLIYKTSKASRWDLMQLQAKLDATRNSIPGAKRWHKDVMSNLGNYYFKPIPYLACQLKEYIYSYYTVVNWRNTIDFFQGQYFTKNLIRKKLHSHHCIWWSEFWQA